MNVEICDMDGTIYTFLMGEDSPIPAREVLARRHHQTFRVMSTHNGELFNPHIATANLNKRDRQRGGYLYNLCRCSERCWKAYVSFLATRKNFNVAQRRFIDG